MTGAPHDGVHTPVSSEMSQTREGPGKALQRGYSTKGILTGLAAARLGGQGGRIYSSSALSAEAAHGMSRGDDEEEETEEDTDLEEDDENKGDETLA